MINTVGFKTSGQGAPPLPDCAQKSPSGSTGTTRFNIPPGKRGGLGRENHRVPSKSWKSGQKPCRQQKSAADSDLSTWGFAFQRGVFPCTAHKAPLSGSSTCQIPDPQDFPPEDNVCLSAWEGHQSCRLCRPGPQGCQYFK